MVDSVIHPFALDVADATRMQYCHNYGAGSQRADAPLADMKTESK